MSSNKILTDWFDELKKKRGECREIDYIFNAPSKKIRSKAALAVCADSSSRSGYEICIPVAVSVELIHSASLIIDDLPSMDDSSVRRGKPAHHIVFTPAVTVLTAVDMISLAFDTVGKVDGLTGELSVALSSLVRGQQMDLKADGVKIQDVLRIHEGKTGALFSFALAGAGLTCGFSEETVEKLRKIGSDMGIVFQLADDMLDSKWTWEKAGKETDKDINKYTHTSEPERMRRIISEKFLALGKTVDSLDFEAISLKRYISELERMVYERL